MPDGVGSVNGNRLGFAKQQEPQSGVNLGRGENHASNGRMPNIGRAGMKCRKVLDLIAQIGASVNKKPMLLIGAYRQLSLRTGLGLNRSLAQLPAVLTGAVPLRKSSPSRRTKDFYVHPWFWLDFRIAVAGDFATQAHFFKRGCSPFHDVFSFSSIVCEGDSLRHNRDGVVRDYEIRWNPS